MRKIIYYVATSIDGFICGANNDIRAFISAGNGVTQYFNDLKDFDTVIMGKNTYEFGYGFGLKPGQRAYPHMTHYIFSNSLKFQHADDGVHVCSVELETIKKLKNTAGSDIYLCGGGIFAGWLLDHNMIDIVKIKLNPIVLGQGIRLFGDSKNDVKLNLIDSQTYEKGLQIITYTINA